MNNFKSLSIEYKSGALFGAIGLVLSIIIGLLTGNSIGTIVLRTLFLAVPFAVLGYGCIIILKKFKLLILPYS